MPAPFFALSLARFFIDADGFGKMVYLGLLILSFFSWVILIDKIRLSKNLNQRSLRFEDLLRKKGHTLLAEIEKKEESPYSLIFASVQQKTLELLERNRFFLQSQKLAKDTFLSQSDMERIKAHAEASILTQIKHMEKYIFVLPMVVTLAPFLGLLGTVWGILVTFSHIESASSLGNTQVLSGLAMALGTTVLGLLVAIPALVGHNYIRSKVKDFIFNMENFSHKMISDIELQYRKVEVD